MCGFYERSCGNCKYYDGVCCMYDCQATVILDTERSAQNCQYYAAGEYDLDELEKTGYK